MASTREAAVFAKSVDCSGHMVESSKNNVAYIASNVISIINEFGAADVVANKANQPIIKDAEKLKATWPRIEHEPFRIICSWCVAHDTCHHQQNGGD